MIHPSFRVWDDIAHHMEYFSIGTTMPVEDLDIMLGTQVFDKLNNQIFENDILYYKYKDVSERGEFEDSLKEEYPIVVFEKGAFLQKCGIGKPLLVNINHWTVKDFRVIGNIYDYPQEYLSQFNNEHVKELLEQQNILRKKRYLK